MTMTYEADTHPSRRRVDTAMMALMVTALIHIGGTVWWASDISRRVTVVEHWAAKTENIPTNIAVLETQLTRFSSQIDKLTTQLERVGNKLQDIVMSNDPKRTSQRDE